MKNIFKVIAVAFVMVLGMQNASAQSLSEDSSRPEVKAKTETAKLATELSLNGDQQRTVFRALVAKEVGYQKNVDGKDSANSAVLADKKSIDAKLDEAMKSTLTSVQYQQWKKG